MSNKELNQLSDEELWQLFPIIITPYQKEWKSNYLAEEKYLYSFIGEENIVHICHIGSTAVEGLTAKPTIDILMEISEETDLFHLIELLESSGYIYSPQPNNPPPHMLFMKGYTKRGFEGQTYHLHVRYRGDWDELYFRDYLIAHPKIATEYAKLKRSLAQRYKNNRDAYTAAKTEFIKKYTLLGRKEADLIK